MVHGKHVRDVICNNIFICEVNAFQYALCTFLKSDIMIKNSCADISIRKKWKNIKLQKESPTFSVITNLYISNEWRAEIFHVPIFRRWQRIRMVLLINSLWWNSTSIRKTASLFLEALLKNYRKTKAKTVSKCRAKWILSGDISTEWKTLNSCISTQPSRQLLVRPASSPCRADGLVPVMTRNTAEDSFIWQLFLGFSWQRKITFSKLSDSPVTYIQHHISVVFNVPATLF